MRARKVLNHQLNTAPYLTLYCGWYTCTLHNVSDKLLYDHVPDLFHPWTMGSGHARLNSSMVDIH